jgi:hypothetical protein
MLKIPSAVWERHIYILFLAKGVPYPPERTNSGACDIIAVAVETGIMISV